MIDDMNMGLTKGDLLEGRYRISHRIGEGGMGVVHAAEHVALHKTCAIKVLHPSEAGDETMITRFRIEAQAAANIRHPNIVEVMDFGITPDKRPFFVMEYLQGDSLADRLNRKGMLDAREAVRITEQILSGLFAAHRMRIVHRDLKPENIFLVEEHGVKGVVKILDFGISKIVTGTPSMAPAPISSNHKALTRKGVVFGTPGYMAPESLFGTGTVDSRADLFSVAVLLFEMITGQQPFRGRDAQSTMLATASKPSPKPRSIAPGISKALEEVVLKGLSKDPDLRFQTAEEFIYGLKGAALPVENQSLPTVSEGSLEPLLPLDGQPSIEVPITVTETAAAPMEFDNSYIEGPDKPPRRAYQRRYMAGSERPSLGVRLKQISIAFSPIPILFVLGLGGAAYYYFVHNSPVHVEGHEDPIDQEIENRVKAMGPRGTRKADIGRHAPTETITIWLDAIPKTLTVSIDGKDVFERPLIVLKGSHPVKVEFRSPGYKDQILSIVPDQEQTITIRLKKTKGARQKAEP